MSNKFNHQEVEKESGSSDNLNLAGPGGFPVATERFLILAIQIAAALEELHSRNIICGNISPEVMYMDTKTGLVKIAGPSSSSRSTRHGETNLTYVSPEQTGRMNCPVDTRTDIYSLGVVFYELLTGNPPFVAADPLELVYFHLARTAVAPVVLLPAIPAVLSEIVMKLMAKAPEERYQTVMGLKSDLQECLDQWRSAEKINPFTLGQYDIPDHLLIPQKLYGRDKEIEALLNAFDRVVDRRTPEYVFVAGYSGIGKTSLVRELHKPVVRERGIFISGKFDQYKRNIPYATIAEAFRELVQQISSENKERIDLWRERLLDALGTNAQLIAEIIPEIELIIGKQPPVRELPPREAQNRFNTVFQQFISVFTTREHPLVVFFDDLQWSDDASLALIELLAEHPGIHYLLFIGAYRDNEVDATHPLIKTIDHIRHKNAPLATINLLPLALPDIVDLLSDAFQADRERVKDLGMLVCEKTAGIPFFLIQFLLLMYDEGLLVFEKDKRIWSWNIEQIQAKGYTDNVVDLMVKQLLKFPEETQNVLKIAACIGNRFELETLAAITGVSAAKSIDMLEEAVQKGLILDQAEQGFSFLHDRVQQAAYSLIPEDSRPAVHLRIGRLMLQQTSPEVLEERVFDIVNQMNKGWTLINGEEEKIRLAELNLLAGKKAKASTAYRSAMDYLSSGTRLLPEEHWNSHYELSYDLFLDLAESTFMNGDLDEAEHLLSWVIAHVKNKSHLARASYIKVYLYHVKGASNKGAETGIECLKQLDFELSLNPTREQAHAEYARVWQNLGDRHIEDLINLPAMTDPDMLMAVRILGVLYVPAVYTNVNLAMTLLSSMVNISMKYGNCDISPLGYVAFGELIGPVFNDYRRGYRFGQLGYDIVETTKEHPFRGQVDFQYAQFINPFINHISTSIGILARGFELTVTAGDFPFACYCCQSIVTDHLVNGTPLEDVYLDSEKRLKFVREGKFKISELVIRSMQQLIKNLQGLTDHFSTFNDSDFNQNEFEAYLEENKGPLAIGVVRYHIRKLQACYFRGDYEQGIQLIDKIAPLLWTMPSFQEVPEYYYYAALTLAAHLGKETTSERPRHMQTLLAHRDQMRIWAEDCPVNFRCKYALVSAEMARISGDDLQAMKLYEEAVHSAGKSGFLHNQAIAYEVAARYYKARDYDLVARTYFSEARECYYRWGAHGKVKQMKQIYRLPENREFKTGGSYLTGQLDAISVVKASQAISGEIVLDSLLDTLMQTVLENTGAQKGCLILLHNDELILEVQAAIDGEEIKVTRPHPSGLAGYVPELVINYVRRSRNNIILEDARDLNMFSNDPYFVEKQPVSVLCLPILRKTNLAGVVYLENNLMKGTFTGDRLSILELLAAQAAISLENASLYRDQISMEEQLKELNQRLEDIIDFLPDATFVLNKDGKVIAWNKAMEELTGIPKSEIIGRGDYEYSLAFYNTKRPLMADLLLNQDVDIASSYDFFKRSGITVTGEVFIPRVNQGRGAYLMAVASPLQDRRGNIMGVIESIRDITERKKAEDANNRLRNLLRDTIDSMHSIIVCIDVDGIINQWNIEAERFAGRNREEALGRNVLEMLPIMNKCGASLNEALVNGRISREEKVTVRHDGNTLYLNINIYPLVSAGIDGAVIRMDDVTDAKLKEEQLIQAQKMETVGRLAGGIAHDFNNMLGVILGHTDLAMTKMQKTEPDQPLGFHLREIHKAAKRSADLTHQLLAFARKQTVSPKVLDLNETVTGMLKILHRLIGEDIHLAWLPHAKLCLVNMDPSQIDQILANLCVNSRDAIAGVGKITIESENIGIDETFCANHPEFSPGEYVLLAVSDDGCGMDKETQDRLFEPFFTTKETGKGTGLGLATVYGIVKQNNGFINVHSEPGQGTTFRIYLPRRIGKAEQPGVEEPQESFTRGRETLLLVEDEPSILRLSKDMLEAQGYQVLTAANPGAAIRLANEHHGDIYILITDVVMPEMNGRDLAQNILSLYPNIKVLFMSGYTADVIANHGVLDEGIHFIQKPFSRKSLLSKVREILDQK